ncbi:TonB-dependent receptor [Parabacteroides johnsonii]|uniref:TonB-dependent receptor n=1 Tax=Parabacteroides johnsonii TaxID=387661 RepID=UPI00242F89F2|nr:TonB-dependent receptor [Parabacteroides johnsonii]
MKLYIFLLFCSIGLVQAMNSYAQKATVSLNMQNQTVQSVLDEIENQSEFSFFFNTKHVDLNRRVSVDANKSDIFKVLDNIFAGTNVRYSVVDKKIILSTEKKESLQTNQDKKITGIVKDQHGEPVIGANVSVKGTTIGTITGIDGDFTLEVPANSLIQVSYIGYVPQEHRLEGKSHLDIMLKEDSQALEEIVVVGYGTMKKKDLTGAVSSVGGDELVGRKAVQVSQALQGTMPGVMVTRDNNAPGASATIHVRGITTIGDTNPLIIVDGMPTDDINHVNPNDIESISVLKDAASASIYGSQAAAGVVLITTKRAKTDQFSIEYNFEYGLEIPTELPEYVNAVRYMEMTNELRWNDNNNDPNSQYPTYAKEYIDSYVENNRKNPDLYPITDWQDLMLKSSAPRQSHVIKVMGGSPKIKTAASFVYDNIDALHDNRSYERFTSRINNDLTINKLFKATFDVNFMRIIDKQASLDPMYQIRNSAPIYAAKWSNGNIAEGKNGTNIYGRLTKGGYDHQKQNQIGGKIGLDFTPMDGLKISGIFSPVFNNTKRKKFFTAVPWYDWEDPSRLGGYLTGANTTSLSEDRNDNYRLTTQFLANYDKAFGKHQINVLVGYENYYAFNEDLTASRGNYELTSYPYLDIGPQELRDNSGTAYENARRSIFGRFMYHYMDKYLFQANIRYDASSRFAEGYRWGAFPSFSLGWVVSEESFMKNISAVSFLKLRTSWGSLGNERIGNYPYQATIDFGSSLFYQDDKVISKTTAAQRRYAIHDITWETTETFDIGIDANFLDNRLRFSGDYYKKKTKDMLLALQIPTYMGFDNPEQNTGRMNTKGWELSIGWNDVVGDWRYSATLNLSDFKSVMGDLGGTEFLGDQIKVKGSEFNEWYGYISEGIYQTQEEVDKSAKTSKSVKPGDVKYRDISGPDGKPDGIISSEYDRVLLGGSLPRYMYGGNISVNYKNIDFGLSFQGVGKQKSRITKTMVEPLKGGGWENISSLLDGNVYSHYNTPEENLKAIYPRLTISNAGNNYAMSDFWLFNGRYFRLKNLNFGYTLPQRWVSSVFMQNVRVYASVSDLFCINKYPKGWDPEMGDSAYPITTSVLFGISVKF